MFAMKDIFKKILIQLFLHIAAKKMVSSTHKALTPHMGFSRACSSSDTAVSADSGGRGVSPAGGHHFRFQTQVVGAPVTPLLSDLDPFSEVR